MEETFNAHLGRKLRMRRLSLGLTQTKVANAINVTLGLPFLRMTPDHGPNNSMLGKNKSNPASLIEVFKFLNQIRGN